MVALESILEARTKAGSKLLKFSVYQWSHKNEIGQGELFYCRTGDMDGINEFNRSESKSSELKIIYRI